MTWNEIYERADGAACGESSLKAKDEARHQVRQFVMDIGCPDPDNDEIPEETIEKYCDSMNIKFDECGSIIDLRLPYRIERLIYERKQNEYIRADIYAMTQEIMTNNEYTYEIDDEQMDKMVKMYHHDFDCDISYNDTIQYIIREVLKK